MDSAQEKPDPNELDKPVEIFIGKLLRTGVAVAAVVVLIGGILFLRRYGFSRPDYYSFRSEPERLRSVPGIVKHAFASEPRAVIQFGLLLLIATPVVRVGFTVFAFLHERDWTYVLVTLIVLGLLIFSLTS